MSAEKHICKGCGKSIENNERATKVQIGTLRTINRKNPSDKAVWGYMHERCFLITIGDCKGLQSLLKAS